MLTTRQRLLDTYQIFFSSAFFNQRKFVLHVFTLGSSRQRLLSVVKEQLARFRNFFRRDGMSIQPNTEVWLLANTDNQFKALSPLAERIPGARLVSTRNRFSTQRDGVAFVNFHRYALSAAGWKDFFRLRRIGKKELSENYEQFFHYFWNGIGEYHSICKVLKKYRPKILIISNDHIPFYRNVLHACKNTGVPILYVQHACITDNFPSLDYDLSLLDGEDALEKYLASGPIVGEYALVGIGKFDAFATKIVDRQSIRQIGIPYSKAAKFPQLIAIHEELKAAYPTIEITFRSHPSDRRTLPGVLASAKYSRGGEEDIFTYLARMDLIIADDTSTHLEATLMNVTSWYYNFHQGESYDIYGFIKNGLIDEKKSVTDIIRDLSAIKDKRPPVRHRAKRYYAPMNTDHDGKSVEIMLKAINDFCQRRQIERC